MKKVKIQMNFTSTRNKATSLKGNCPVRTMVIIHQDEGEEFINVFAKKISCTFGKQVMKTTCFLNGDKELL